MTMQTVQECNRVVRSSDLSILRRSDTDQRPASQRPSFLRRASTLRKFSPIVSTEQYNSDANAGYYGPYAHLRKELDHTYHVNYRKERQWLQDSIIEDMLEVTSEQENICVTPTEPWMLFTVGPRGAGKKHVIRELVLEGRLPLLAFVHVDPDEIRRRLPEFDSFAHKSPCLVDELTRKESGFIAEILALAAIQAGWNVIFDGGMRDAEWHVQWIERLRGDYSCLKFGLLHITAPPVLFAKRSQKKVLETGREIPHECIQNSLDSIPDSLLMVQPVVDFYCEIHNGEEELELRRDEPIEWGQFELTFLQTCAWKPGMKGSNNLNLKREVSVEESQESIRMSIQRTRVRRRRFSVLISSEENNRSNDMHFFGKYSHIRKTLDYNYHANYTFERQKLQDAIITDMLDAAIILDVDGNIGTVPTEPWIVFTAGAMGAGKSHTMNVLVQKGRFPLKAFVIVDPDEIRRLLPEYHMYIDENPELAGAMTHKEAGFIVEILTLAALQAGKNVLLDGSLRDADWYQLYFARLKDEFPSVRQAILHVTAPREAVFQRAAERAITTGRIVPRDVLETALEQVPRSVKVLAPLVDYYAELNNDQNTDDIELTKPVRSTWDEFRAKWHQ
jgi:predicted kinase